MPQFIIRWNAGYGDEYEAIEAENLEEAEKCAYEQWRETAESNADFEAEEYSEEKAEEYRI